MKNHLLFSILLLVSLFTCAQAKDSTSEKKMQIKAGLQFISNQTYAGRTDSLNLPVLNPEVNLMFQKGFFIRTKGYLNLSGGQTTFDGISIEPGYEFLKNNWNGSFSVVKNFISDSSNLIIAPVNASLEFYLDKETRILTPFIGSEYVFSGEGNDFIMYGGFSKYIAFSKENKKLMVEEEPAFSLTAGSQNFYYSFLKSFSSNGSKNSRGKGRGGSVGLTPTTTQLIGQESKKITILSSEIELPLTLSTHRLKWIATPALEIPINLLSKGNSGTQTASPFFYLTTELLFSF